MKHNIKELLETINRFKVNHPDVDVDKIEIVYERIEDRLIENGWTTKKFITYEGPVSPQNLYEREMITTFTSYFNKDEQGMWSLCITAHY